MIYSIFAQLKNGAIGNNNNIPWLDKKIRPYVKNIVRYDLDNFIKITEDNPIVMGYNTFLSLQCKPLKNRLDHYVVTSKDLSNEIDPIFKKITLEDILKKYISSKDNNIICIGGGKLYKELIKYSSIIWRSIFTIKELENKEFDTYISKEVTNYIEQNCYNESSWEKCEDNGNKILIQKFIQLV